MEIAYAAKAFLCRAMARLVDQEGLAMDVCSGGEVAVAAAAGFPGARMVLHGNVKTDEDLKTALAVGVGRIVIDPIASLSSTYNQVGRPPVVAVARGAAVPMLRRETVEDLLHRDAG